MYLFAYLFTYCLPNNVVRLYHRYRHYILWSASASVPVASSELGEWV